MFILIKKVVFKIVINKKKMIFDRMFLIYGIVGINVFFIYVFYCNWNLRLFIDFKGKKNFFFENLIRVVCLGDIFVEYFKDKIFIKLILFICLFVYLNIVCVFVFFYWL